jgi:hypothetical protein
MKTVGTQFCSSLTKREYFAAMAMQGILGTEYGVTSMAEGIAMTSIRIADELIKELNNTTNEKEQKG